MVTSLALAVNSTLSRDILVATLSKVEDSVTANGSAVTGVRVDFEACRALEAGSTSLGDTLTVERKTSCNRVNQGVNFHLRWHSPAEFKKRPASQVSQVTEVVAVVLQVPEVQPTGRVQPKNHQSSFKI